MTVNSVRPTVGLLVSGGLDSSILLAHLLDRGQRVRPIYIRFGHVWQDAEIASLRHYLSTLDCPRLEPLVLLDMPVADVYDGHWSVTGQEVPSAESPDEAVFLPGRNVLLIVKAALWCELRGIEELALAPLRSNPFPDATPAFFTQLEAVLNQGSVGHVRLVRPFAEFSKQQVMQLGRDYPLELTFSCIDPRRELHCGSCNKCAERQNAFRLIGASDPTSYYREAPDSSQQASGVRR